MSNETVIPNHNPNLRLLTVVCCDESTTPTIETRLIIGWIIGGDQARPLVLGFSPAGDATEYDFYTRSGVLDLATGKVFSLCGDCCWETERTFVDKVSAEGRQAAINMANESGVATQWESCEPSGEQVSIEMAPEVEQPPKMAAGPGYGDRSASYAAMLEHERERDRELEATLAAARKPKERSPMRDGPSAESIAAMKAHDPYKR